jgi:hypothetical protein
MKRIKKFISVFFLVYLLNNIGFGQNLSNELEVTFEPKFRVYPTENIFTFIELNTSSGTIYLLKFSLEEDGGRVKVLHSFGDYVSIEEEINGRFKLLPTKNMWNFLLLDQMDGRTWQVQWGFEQEDFGVFPIKGSWEKN